MSTKQLNITLPADLLNEFKEHCYLNGITLAGLMRDLIPRVLSEDIPIDVRAIRRADFNYRHANTATNGSRF